MTRIRRTQCTPCRRALAQGAVLLAGMALLAACASTNTGAVATPTSSVVPTLTSGSSPALTPTPPAAAGSVLPSPSASGTLAVFGSVSLGALPADVSGNANLFSEAPDGAVFSADGSIVYVINGDQAPVVAEHAAGPVLALAASATDLYVQTGMTVTDYNRQSGSQGRQWSLGGTGAPSEARLVAAGGVLWSWTDSSSDASGFEPATIRRIAPPAPTVQVIDTDADLWVAATSMTLYYEGGADNGGQNGDLISVGASGTKTRVPEQTYGGPLAVGGGAVVLQDGSTLAAFDATTLVQQVTATTSVPQGSLAGTGAGVLAVASPCSTPAGCATARVARVDPQTATEFDPLTLPGAEFALSGPYPVVVASNAGTTTLVRLTSNSTGGTQGLVAQDESVVAGINGNCAAFVPSASCAGLYSVATTPDGSGGTLLAIELDQTTGDACGRGTVWFFDGGTLLTDASALPPSTGQGTGGGLSGVSGEAARQIPGVSSPGPDEIAVAFVVSNPNQAGGTSCAGNGNAGTDTYVYRDTSSGLALVSGTPPTPPDVIVQG